MHAPINPLYLHSGYWHIVHVTHAPITFALWVLTHCSCDTHAPITLALWVLTLFMRHTCTHYTCTLGTYWNCSCDTHAPITLALWVLTQFSRDIHTLIIPALRVLTHCSCDTCTHYTCILGTDTVHVTYTPPLYLHSGYWHCSCDIHPPIIPALWVLTLFMWHTHTHYTCTLGTNTVHVTHTLPLYLHSGYWHCSCDIHPPIILAVWVLTIQQCMLVSVSWHWKLILTQRNTATCWSAFILSINLPLKTDTVTGLKLMDSVPHRGICLYWFTIG